MSMGCKRCLFVIVHGAEVFHLVFVENVGNMTSVGGKETLANANSVKLCGSMDKTMIRIFFVVGLAVKLSQPCADPTRTPASFPHVLGYLMKRRSQYARFSFVWQVADDPYTSPSDHSLSAG